MALIGGTIAAATTPYVPAVTAKDPTGKKIMGKDDFLKLFLVQLKNQDPEKTQDQSQFMAQLAQFSSLEQMQNLNTNQQAATSASQLGAASNLLGRVIDVIDDQGNPMTGQVTSVRLEKGEPKLMLGLRSFTMKQLVQVH